MAYTSTPEQSTYKTERYSFIGNLQQIDGVSRANQRLVNLIPELNYVAATQEKTYYVKKRPGLKLRNIKPNATARGIYNWQGKIIEVLGINVYVDNSIVGGVTAGNGPVGFSEYFGQTYGQALIILDGTAGWVLKPDNTWIQITSANFPTPHVPTPVTIDEYLIVAKAGTGDFYNSSLDDPTTWTPGDFITSEMFPDAINALTKFKNYIVVCGSQSIEFFYDAGIADGSPFQRSDAVVQQVGVSVPGTLQTTEDVIIFAGDTGRGGKSIWTIEKFKNIDICNEQVRMAMDAEGNNITNATSLILRTAGHHLYLLNLSNRSFVYDFDLKMWHEWMWNGTRFDFPYSTNNTNGNPVLQNSTSGYTYELDQFTYKDDSVQLVCVLQTDPIDFKSYNRKSWNRITIGSDSDGNADSFMQINWTDDNYQTLQGGRQLNINAVMPCIYKMGGLGRSRSFKFTYVDNRPLRLEYFEIDANILMH